MGESTSQLPSSSLSRASLERFLESFLTMLFALNEEASCMQDAENNWERVDKCVKELVSKIFNDLGLTNEHISFEEFASWYTGGGHEVTPWLELLSLDKWPRTEDARDDEGQNNDDEEDENVTELEEEFSEEEEEEEN